VLSSPQWLRIALSMAVISGSATVLNAALIDSFTVPDFNELVESSSANTFGVDSTTQSPLSTSQIIGGERYFEVGTNSVSPGDPDARVLAEMNGFTADPDFDVVMTAPNTGVFSSFATVVWGNSTPLNFDAGTDIDFLLTLEDIDVSAIAVESAQFLLRIVTSTGTDVVTVDALDAGGFLSPTYRFSGFTGVDFSDIDQIELTLEVELDSANSTNFSVSYSQLETVAPIPEPSSVLLIGMVVFGAGLRRWRRNRRGAASAA